MCALDEIKDYIVEVLKRKGLSKEDSESIYSEISHGFIRQFAGNFLYIESYRKRIERNQQIIHDFNCKYSHLSKCIRYKALANEYGISERHIERIIKSF